MNHRINLVFTIGLVVVILIASYISIVTKPVMGFLFLYFPLFGVAWKLYYDRKKQNIPDPSYPFMEVSGVYALLIFIFIISEYK